MYSGDNCDLEDGRCEDSDLEETKFRKCVAGARKVTTFLLSHVGLISLVISYCVLGAFTFEGLEKQHELNVKKSVSYVRAEVSKHLWEMTEKNSYIKPEEWKQNATIRLQIFETDLIRLMKKSGWDGSESNSTQQWTFSGALFYSIVVITTIGFGNLTPKTDWGKIVTMFYAILGIPLMLLCLSHVGDFLANAFRILYWKVCCYMCNRQAARFASPPPMPRVRSIRGAPFSKFSGTRGTIRRSIRTRSARNSQRSADSAYSESAAIPAVAESVFRRVHSTEEFRRHRRGGPLLSTGSFRRQRSPSPRPRGPLPPKPGIGQRRTNYKRSTRSAEPSNLSIPLNLPVLYNKYAEEIVPPRVDGFRTRYAGRNYVQPILLEQFELDEYIPYVPAEDEEYLWEDEIRKRPVPIWLCVLLVFSYILGGAAIFSKWENWTFLDSAYFCFVTLTTIGFGDFVPLSGQNRGHANVEASIALCSLYLLFGISLLAMSFNLVQEEVISSIKRIASRLGIIKEQEAL